MPAPALLRRAERACWAAGALLACICIGGFLDARLHQTLENRRLEAALSHAGPQPPSAAPRAAGSLVGRLEIPRLHVSAIVLEGSDSGTLRVAVGRVPETADPGQPGNVVLGGHRDTFFRPLRLVRAGDRVALVTPGGTFHYVVEWTSVVDSTDTASLRPTADPSLTLVTCYPFHYLGPAPQRFVVRARQVAPRPATAARKMIRTLEVN